MSLHLLKPIEHTTLRVNPKVNYGLQVIMMWKYRFIQCNKGTTLAGDLDRRRDSACVRAGGIWEISVPFCSFVL